MSGYIHLHGNPLVLGCRCSGLWGKPLLFRVSPLEEASKHPAYLSIYCWVVDVVRNVA